MANGKDSDPHRYATCPSVRPGLKREFAFALKSQGEVPNYRCRTRSGKNPVAASAAILSRGGKKQKKGNDREKLSEVSTKETDRPSEEIVAVGIPTTDVGNYVGGVPISTLSKEELQKDDINLVSTVLADGKEGHERVKIQVDKPKNSLVPHPLALSSEVSNSSLENGSVAEHSAVVDGKRGFKVGSSLAEKPARRFTRSALRLLPATAAPEKKQEGNPGEVKPKKKFTQGTSMLLETTPSTSFTNEKRNIWESNHLPFQQENFVKLPIIADNCGRVDFESGHVDESIKAGLECLVPATSMSGVDEDNKRNNVVPSENTITNIPIRRRKRSLLKTANEKSAVADTCKHPSVRFTESKGSKHDNNTLRRALKKKMELKMSKKITLTKPPSNIRELLGTGMLEGFPVRYISCLGKSIERQGIVRGNGILCSCTSCRGKVVVSAHLFEIHAGSTKKHPSNFIYLQNGKSIREVLKMCNGASMDRLEAVIQDAIGPLPPKKLSVCQKCDGIACTKKFPFLCKSCSESSYQQAVQISSHGMANSAKLVGRDLESVTSDGTGSNISLQKKNGDRKLTKKDIGLHKLVFMVDILPQGTEVGYYLRGKRLLVGYIKDSGIFCRCCNCVLSPSQFEAHAGQASRRKPYNNIYTSNGVSLHELSVSLSKGRKLSASENDDLCGICADGGNLLLCDLCPRAFHKECVGLSYIPDGDWFCQYCQNLQQKDKCLASNNNAIAAGRVAGVDPIEQIIKRCIRIVGTPENNAGVCALCREHDFRRSGFDRRTVIICDQCEIEYHVGCLKDHGMADLKKLPQGEWFCCSECSSIHSALYKLLGRGPETLEELDANTIRTKLDKKGLSKDAAADIRWKLLSGRSDSADSKLLLSQAVSIFRESFDPIIDPISGRDLIPFMVYGRNMRDQDYGGVYCMVLMQKSSVISAGLLRVLGCQVAELPLVATKRICQGLGYFQSLFSCIERLLKSLKVKNFVLPAADDAVSMWTNKFGFTKLTQTQLLEHVKSAQPIVFQGTSMLHKTVDSPPEPPPVVNDEERCRES